MTKEALCRNIKARNYILERLESMPIGSSFEYNGLKITRWGEVIYNGRTILRERKVRPSSYDGLFL